jgi:hypothetical protein
MPHCTGVARVDRLLIRIGRLDAGRWLALGQDEMSMPRDIDRLATAELARPDLSSGDYELLMAPVRSALSLCSARSR